ncbi:MAG: Mrp/NBP35 family ATP-binding protein [Armatimonadetes bacterium]|nr:Mrp/NBP35 family ATP-binding protein [Armatimonadota bacterium]
MSDPWRARYQPSSDRAGGTAGEYEQQEQRIREKSANILHKILVLSGKGGVGKSTVAAHLAWALALRGSRTGLLDADINGPTIPLLMGLAGQRFRVLEPVAVLEQLQVMSIAFLLDDPDSPTIWRGPLKGGVIRQFIADVEWGPLDYLVVDLPPGTGDEPLTVGQMFPDADGGVIVTTPQEASLSVCRKAINFLHALKLPVLGVIENMSGFVCPHCGQRTDVLMSGGGEDMAARMGVPFLGRVPLAPEIAALGDQGRPLLGPGASEAVRLAFSATVDELLRGLQQRQSPAQAAE